MNEFRVPTVEVEAQVLGADGRSLSGVFYMPALSAVQEGRMRPEEWINGPLPFFPFRTADDASSLLLNKSQVVALVVAADPDAAAAPWDAEAPVRRLEVEAGDHRFEGSVVIDMPANQQRVVDYVNRPEAFLLLRGEDRHYLIAKSRISRVIDVGRP